MDIMELGAIGELVGGAAVLVTLIYLAVQVRQGNSQNRSESTRTLLIAYNGLLQELTDPSFADAFRRASLDYFSLPGLDQTRVHSFLERSWRIGYANYLIDPKSENPLSSLVDTTFAITLKTPGFEQWWGRFKVAPQAIGQGYVERIDEMRRSPDLPTVYELGPWYHPGDTNGASS